ncbi:MAG TPA: hypothetical protein VFA68_08895 [Terriglobales bacterium]|nr:hypothetical protein [Terriglobales bacterium]
MTRAVAFLAAALLAATLGAAQNAPTGAAAGSQRSSDVNGQSHTITGCLSSSSLGDNHFKLTEDKTGAVYNLTGLTDQLTSHAGQEVRVTGVDNSKGSPNAGSYDSPNPSAGPTQDKGGTASNPNAAASSGGSDRMSLQVTSVEKIADHCSSVGNGKPQGAGAESQRAAASVKFISYKGGTATDGEGTLAPSSDVGQNNSTQTDAPTQNGTQDETTTDLPRTATALPLLGILGLGSLVAGFIVRR